jgi:transposase-like protein
LALVHLRASGRLPDIVYQGVGTTKPIDRDAIYRKRAFDPDIIELCVRWYITYRLTLPRVPRKVTLDGHLPSRRALWLLRREHPCWRNVKVRTNKYFNNLIEQDHRAIKRRSASMAGFKSFANAAITIAGIELAHRIRKGQFSFGRGRRRHGWSRKAEWAMALA